MHYISLMSSHPLFDLCKYSANVGEWWNSRIDLYFGHSFISDVILPITICNKKLWEGSMSTAILSLSTYGLISQCNKIGYSFFCVLFYWYFFRFVRDQRRKRWLTEISFKWIILNILLNKYFFGKLNFWNALMIL